MTDNNVADTYGGAPAKQRIPLPIPVRPVPTYTDGGDPNVMADSDRIVDQLKTTMAREVSTINRPLPERQPMAPLISPLKEIAMRIKKLVHDDGEQFGDELKAKIGTADSMSCAKALQLWADDTLKTEKTPESGS